MQSLSPPAGGFFVPTPVLATFSVERGYALVAARASAPAKQQWRRAHERLLEDLASDGISIEMLHMLPGRLHFACAARKAARATALADRLGFRSQTIAPCAKISASSPDVPNAAGLAAAVFRALKAAHVALLHFADSGTTMTLLVAQHQADGAQRALRSVFAPQAPTNASRLSVDAELCRVRIGGRTIRIGRRQAAILKLLSDRAGTIFAVEEIAHAMFGATDKEALTAVRVHIHNLRKKIEFDADDPRHILTVPNRGYTFEDL